MGDIIDEANQVAQCYSCPWYKSCVLPIRYSAEDIRRQVASSLGNTSVEKIDATTEELIASMANAAQASLLEGCPIFIARLRSHPELAQRIKEMMQHWAEDD